MCTGHVERILTAFAAAACVRRLDGSLARVGHEYVCIGIIHRHIVLSPPPPPPLLSIIIIIIHHSHAEVYQRVAVTINLLRNSESVARI